MSITAAAIERHRAIGQIACAKLKTILKIIERKLKARSALSPKCAKCFRFSIHWIQCGSNEFSKIEITSIGHPFRISSVIQASESCLSRRHACWSHEPRVNIARHLTSLITLTTCKLQVVKNLRSYNPKQNLTRQGIRHVELTKLN